MNIKQTEKLSELIEDFQSAIGQSRVTVSIKEAANLTGISEQTLFRKIQAGELVTMKPNYSKRSRRVIQLRELARFLIGAQD